MAKTTAPAEYSDLDNAGKIFPWTSNKRDTKVFRFACELYELVDKKILQEALDATIEEFPIFRSSLRQGLFWYYLRPSNIMPVVEEENEAPCSSIYDSNRYNLLFEVTYFGKRINLEVYHALTDGTGALQFLRTLIYNYICLKYYQNKQPPALDLDASFTQKAEDSFKKYYAKPIKIKSKTVNAYKIRGAKTPVSYIKVIEGTMPVKSIIEKVHQYNTTMSVFLCSVLLCAINKNTALSQKKRPIVATVPVNLRNHFESESVRNFFCTINVGYDFGSQPNDLESVIKKISTDFKEKLTIEHLSSRMNGFSAIERNAFARITPLFLKNIVMRAAGKLSDKETTSSISNIGRIKMPDGFEQYIRIFDVFISTAKLQLCLCSYHDTLTLSFSSAFRSTDIQKDFFRTLTNMGIEIEIATNEIAGGLQNEIL